MDIKHNKVALGAVAGMALLAASAIPAQSQDWSQERTVNLQFAMYAGPNGADARVFEAWVEKVAEATHGTVDIEIFYAGALLSATDMLDGIANGRADIGAMAHVYNPAETPLTYVLSVPYTPGSSQSRVSALRDLYAHNEAFRRQYQENGVENLFTLAMASPPVTGCSHPVTSLEDLRGRRVRAGGMFVAAWEPTGAQVVALPAGDISEAMDRGLIDCWTGISMDSVPGFGMHEATPFLYDTGWGDFGSYEVIMNRDRWDSLSDNQRAAINAATDGLIAEDLPEIMNAAVAEACKALLSSSEMHVLPEEMQHDWRNLVEEGVLESWYTLVENGGYTREDAISVRSDYIAAIERIDPSASLSNSAIARCQQGLL